MIPLKRSIASIPPFHTRTPLFSPAGLPPPPLAVCTPGEVPKELGQLTRLTRLSLGSCGLIGEDCLASCRDEKNRIHGEHLPEQCAARAGDGRELFCCPRRVYIVMGQEKTRPGFGFGLAHVVSRTRARMKCRPRIPPMNTPLEQLSTSAKRFPLFSFCKFQLPWRFLKNNVFVFCVCVSPFFSVASPRYHPPRARAAEVPRAPGPVR